MKLKSIAGFTLIEMLIVIAVISILASIAIPAYQESVAKAKRADAQGALYGLATAMERFYTENSSYCDAGGAGGADSCGAATNDSGTPSIFNSTVPVDGGTAFYNLTISAVAANTYTLTATRTGSMAGDKCGDFTLTNTNTQGIVNNTAALGNCWR